MGSTADQHGDESSESAHVGTARRMAPATSTTRRWVVSVRQRTAYTMLTTCAVVREHPATIGRTSHTSHDSWTIRYGAILECLTRLQQRPAGSRPAPTLRTLHDQGA